MQRGKYRAAGGGKTMQSERVVAESNKRYHETLTVAVFDRQRTLSLPCLNYPVHAQTR